MPKVYSVIEVRPRTWGMIVAGITFFISTTMVLGILWPMERSKRRTAEDARQRLTVHAHRLAQIKQELQTSLAEERERNQAILTALDQTQRQVASQRAQLDSQSAQIDQLSTDLAQESQLRNYLESAVTGTQQKIATASSEGKNIELGRIAVGPKDTHSRVLQVAPEMGFVILAMGQEMALEPGQLVEIIRGDQVIARAQVERVSTKLCSAKILPEWRQASIQESDEVSLASK